MSAKRHVAQQKVGELWGKSRPSIQQPTGKMKPGHHIKLVTVPTQQLARR